MLNFSSDDLPCYQTTPVSDSLFQRPRHHPVQNPHTAHCWLLPSEAQAWNRISFSQEFVIQVNFVFRKAFGSCGPPRQCQLPMTTTTMTHTAPAPLGSPAPPKPPWQGLNVSFSCPLSWRRLAGNASETCFQVSTTFTLYGSTSSSMLVGLYNMSSISNHFKSGLSSLHLISCVHVFRCRLPQLLLPLHNCHPGWHGAPAVWWHRGTGGSSGSKSKV